MMAVLATMAILAAGEPKSTKAVPATILRMIALQGIIRHLKQERARIDAALTALATLSTTFAPRTRKRRQLSAAARARIAAAQRKRWARWRASKK
jgi:hypothetical protein